jgi:large subunit ribosomal protein L24
MAARIKKGDQVLVITGAQKGARGEVLQVMPSDERAIVRGVRLIKRHQKQTRMGQPGGIIEREAPIHLSNLKLVDPASGKPTKVGFRTLENGTKARVAKATGELIEN